MNTHYPSASDDVAAPGKFEAERFAFTAQEWLPDTPILDVDTATQCVSHSLIKSVEKTGVNRASEWRDGLDHAKDERTLEGVGCSAC